jgi:hypothetical protein
LGSSPGVGGAGIADVGTDATFEKRKEVRALFDPPGGDTET